MEGVHYHTIEEMLEYEEKIRVVHFGTFSPSGMERSFS